MPDAKAFLRNSVFIGDHGTDLPHHLGDRFDRDGEIIGCVRKTEGKLRVDVFEIGKIDIDETVERTNRFRRLKGARVVNDRDRQAGALCKQQRIDESVPVRGRRDEVDIMCAESLEFQYRFRKA